MHVSVWELTEEEARLPLLYMGTLFVVQASAGIERAVLLIVRYGIRCGIVW